MSTHTPSTDKLVKALRSNADDRLFMLLSIVMATFALVWGVACTMIGLTLASLIPLGFVGAAVSLAVTYKVYDARKFALRGMLLLSIVSPFLFQSALGGGEVSGMAMLWSLIGLIAAVNLERGWRRYFWMSLQAMLLVCYAVADPVLEALVQAPDSALPAPHTMLSINMASVFPACFLLADALLRQQRSMRKRMYDAQRRQELKHTEEIERHHQELRASLEYARRIQTATWPDLGRLPELLDDHFVIYRPKEAVGGDLFWHGRSGDKSYLVLMDCTGHGVPGSLVSMLCQGLLSEVVYQGNGIGPVEVIRLTQRLMDIRLNRTRTGNADGADMGVLCFDHHRQQVSYAGLGCGLVVADGDAVFSVKGQRSMAYLNLPEGYALQETYLKLSPNARLYMHSDGILDQFCKEDKRKLSIKGFSRIVQELADLPMQEQRSGFLAAIDAWKGDSTQVDDILVIGLQPMEDWLTEQASSDAARQVAA